VVPVRYFDPGRFRARLGFFSLKPRSVIDTFSPAMADCITQTLQAARYDLIIASQTRLAGYAPYFQGVPALFEEVEVGIIYEEYAQAQSLAHRLRYGLTWAKHRHYLRSLLPAFGACTVVSEPEQRFFRHNIGRGGERVEVIPNCLDVAAYQDFLGAPEPDTLIYTGSFSYFPNHEAMLWFTEQVLPLVAAQVPGVKLTITGNAAGRPLPPSPHVHHAGFVDDVRPYVARAWISLAPLWSGGGTRLKILEAMALRTPVVATSKGAEGIDAEPGRHLLIADTPAAFAAAVVQLLQDPALRRTLADNAYELVNERYDWTAVTPRLLNLVHSLTDATV
jgi:polysaccharide biosynthesis protein PslH